MTRLSEEVAQASMQTKEKRDRLESARRACQETAAAIQAKVEACANSVDVAVPMHSTAVEHFAATEIAAVQLIKHVDTRSSFTAMPKVKRDTRIISESLCAVFALEVTAPLTPSRSTPSSSMKTKRRKDNSRKERPKNGAELRSGRKLKKSGEQKVRQEEHDVDHMTKQ